MSGPALLCSALAGYALGTTPSADVVTRAVSGGTVDLRRSGTGNPGAMNAANLLGHRWGYVILVADIGKGALACVAGRRLGGGTGAHVAGTAAVVGHCYPVWKRFRGGKGVATSAGQCLATFPAYFPIDVAVALATGRWKGRTFPAAVLASAAWVAGGVLWWRRGWRNGWGPSPSPALPLAAVATSAVIISRFIVSPPERAAGYSESASTSSSTSQLR